MTLAHTFGVVVAGSHTAVPVGHLLNHFLPVNGCRLEMSTARICVISATPTNISEPTFRCLNQSVTCRPVGSNGASAAASLLVDTS
jgi:hypothetical protein